jgi:hypothetical protein
MSRTRLVPDADAADYRDESEPWTPDEPFGKSDIRSEPCKPGKGLSWMWLSGGRSALRSG